MLHTHRKRGLKKNCHGEPLPAARCHFMRSGLVSSACPVLRIPSTLSLLFSRRNSFVDAVGAVLFLDVRGGCHPRFAFCSDRARDINKSVKSIVGDTLPLCSARSGSFKQPMDKYRSMGVHCGTFSAQRPNGQCPPFLRT